MAKTLAVVTLGCSKNTVDSEIMMGVLDREGFRLVNDEAEAELLIVNTCGFIQAAKEESIETILRLAQYKENGRCQALLVSGCMAQKYKEELLQEIPEIDGIFGTGNLEELPDLIAKTLQGTRADGVGLADFIYDHQMPRIQSTPSYMAYIKVSEGCDNRCAYCVIPQMRGGYRSRPLESIVEEARALGQRGVKEIILIAQDTTEYGRDLYGRRRLADLLDALVQVEEIRWIRLLYCYPSHFSDEVIAVMAREDKICKYLDIPLQHVHDPLLRRMNRQGSRQEFLDLLSRLRQAMPQIALRTTMIVGLPGETEEAFADLLDFVAEARFDRLGVFTYSQEEGTPAARMDDQVPEEIKEERYHQVMMLQRDISRQVNQGLVGKTMTVLIEGFAEEREGWLFGRSEREAPDIDGLIYVAGDAKVGDMVQVRITEAEDYDLLGEMAP